MCVARSFQCSSFAIHSEKIQRPVGWAQNSLSTSSSGFPAAFLCLSLSLSEDQSTNSIEASASSSSSSSRWAAAPRWVIVIWTVGPEWAGGWWGLKSLGPSAELLLLTTASRGEKCYFQARLYLSLNSTQLCCDKEATLVCVCLKVHQSFRCM